MARSIGNEIPETLRPLFSGEDLAAKEGLTFLLLTAAEGGWPHSCMLSVGEVVATGPRELQVALWPDTNPTRNLDANGRATLALVHDGAGYSILCSARREPDLSPAHGRPLARFVLQVEEVREDRASYATLTSGVTFSLNDPAAVLPRWQATVEALRET